MKAALLDLGGGALLDLDCDEWMDYLLIVVIFF